VYTFSVTLYSAGAQTITVSDVGTQLLDDIVAILVTSPAGNGHKK
jgi:hypothetical protein